MIEVLDGIKIYFDFMLEDHLLYAGEQQQFRDIVGKKTGKGGKGSSVGKGRGYKEVVLNTPPSSVYGVEHLIRLFGKLYVCTTKSRATWCSVVTVKIPLFLSRAKFPTSHVHLLHQYFKDLLG